jgi:hypothetical protein
VILSSVGDSITQQNGLFLWKILDRKGAAEYAANVVLRMRLLLVLAVPLWKFGLLLLFFLHSFTLLSSLKAFA